MKIISLFSGVGGLDLGFIKAGFEIIWSNDSDINVEYTYCENIRTDYFDNRKIEHIPFNQIPDDSTGIIAGLPGKGWSISGSLNGINDRQGQYIFDVSRLIKNKKPLFFLLETLPGFIFKNNRQPFIFILNILEDLGYDISFKLINAKDFGIAQDRKRVYIIGFKKERNISFQIKNSFREIKTMRHVLYDIKDSALNAFNNITPNYTKCIIPNHEFYNADYSPQFLSRNRVRSWDEVSFTIQGDRRHIPIHPDAPKMIKIEKDKYIFKPDNENLYRSFSIRECARLQSFEDNFIFYYNHLNIGYRLVGNATPPKLANELAIQIFKYL